MTETEVIRLVLETVGTFTAIVAAVAWLVSKLATKGDVKGITDRLDTLNGTVAENKDRSLSNEARIDAHTRQEHERTKI